MKTLKQVNQHYGHYGYHIYRDGKHIIVEFDGYCLVSLLGVKVVEVVAGLNQGIWLKYALEASCELLEVITENCDNIDYSQPVDNLQEVLGISDGDLAKLPQETQLLIRHGWHPDMYYLGLQGEVVTLDGDTETGVFLGIPSVATEQCDNTRVCDLPYMVYLDLNTYHYPIWVLLWRYPDSQDFERVYESTYLHLVKDLLTDHLAVRFNQ